MTTSPSKTCQYCGTSGLQWTILGGKYRLAYPSGDLHLCRTQRDKIVKSIHHEPIGPPTYEQHLLKFLTKEGVKHAMKPIPKEEIPPADYMDPWYLFLDATEAKKTGRDRAAKQEIFAEMIP